MREHTHLTINQTDGSAKDPATLFLCRIFQLHTRSCLLLLPGLSPPAGRLTGPKCHQDRVRPGTDTGLRKNQKTMKFSMSSRCSVPPARLSTRCTVTASTPRALPRSQRTTQCSGTSYGDWALPSLRLRFSGKFLVTTGTALP